MEKKVKQFGFLKGNPYDLSQTALSVRGRTRDTERRAEPDSAARQSSYNVEALPSAAVIKRIKLR